MFSTEIQRTVVLLAEKNDTRKSNSYVYIYIFILYDILEKENEISICGGQRNGYAKNSNSKQFGE